MLTISLTFSNPFSSFLASLLAVFGENDVSNDKEAKVPVSRNVRRVIVHREYNAATFENDLALLELETPIKFDAHIGKCFNSSLKRTLRKRRSRYFANVEVITSQIETISVLKIEVNTLKM